MGLGQNMTGLGAGCFYLVARGLHLCHSSVLCPYGTDAAAAGGAQLYVAPSNADRASLASQGWKSLLDCNSLLSRI